MIELPSKLLHGVSREKAECYGKPHIMARYTGSSLKSYRHEEGLCPLCHAAPITNTHHQPQRDPFHFRTEWGTRELRPALFGICGSGTTGCHGLIEANVLRVEWRWDSEEYERMWWDGKFLTWEPHSDALYALGCWAFEDTRTGRRWEYRA